jgi:hypothetical protein
MTKRAVVPFLVLGICALAAVAGEKRAQVSGWVSDEGCGAKHVKPGGADCIRKCLRGGASVGHPEWKPQRMVLVEDVEKSVWVVQNPEALKDHEGEHVKIAAVVNAAQKSLRVTQLLSADRGDGKK